MFLSKCFLCGLPWCTRMHSQTQQGKTPGTAHKAFWYLMAFLHFCALILLFSPSCSFFITCMTNKRIWRFFNVYFSQVYYSCQINIFKRILKLLGAIAIQSCVNTPTKFVQLFFQVEKTPNRLARSTYITYSPTPILLFAPSCRRGYFHYMHDP